MSIEFIDLAADNGVVVLTIPPHTSHKLQPLDVCTDHLSVSTTAKLMPGL